MKKMTNNSTKGTATEVKVFFDLSPVDDWPPFASEYLWATPLKDDLYKINNVPFFADDVSYSDVVRAKSLGSRLTYLEVVFPSKNTTLRVFCFDANKRERFLDILEKYKCIYEGAYDQEYIVANLDISVLDKIEVELLSLEELEVFEYEFSCLRRSEE
ncbi:MAG: DUF4265 domain-containing protein [Betaproteobacteria bacterium]|nr:DUF4265 domain-containing protein [Betaproteobacteria bacterium]